MKINGNLILKVLLIFPKLLNSQNVENTTNSDFRDYLSTTNFGNKKEDTIYYYGGNKDKIHVIKNDSLAYQYFPSGNLLAQGYIKKDECFEYVDTKKINRISCSYVMDGKWNIYYDTVIKIKHADIFYENGKEWKSFYYDLNQKLIKKVNKINTSTCEDDLNPNGLLIHHVEYCFVNNEKKILSEISVVNGKEIVVVNKPAFIRFFLLNSNFFFFLLLVLVSLKLILAFVLLLFINHRFLDRNPNFLSNAVKIAGTASFSINLKGVDGKYKWLFYFHNTLAVLILVLAVVFFLCINFK